MKVTWQKIIAGMTIVGLILFVLPKETFAAPGFVQSKTSNGNIVGSTGIAFTSNVVAGDVLLAYNYDGNGTGQTIVFSDSQVNTWTTNLSGSLTTDGDTNAIGCAIAGSSAADTVKFTVNGSGAATARLILYEFSGGTCTTDGTNSVHSGTAGQTSYSSGQITTTIDNDILISSGGLDTSNTFTLGSGWSNLVGINPGGGGNFGSTETQIGTVHGNYTGTMTFTSANESIGLIVAYKPSGTSAAVPLHQIAFKANDQVVCMLNRQCLFQ